MVAISKDFTTSLSLHNTCNGGNTKCAGWVIKQMLQSCDDNLQKAGEQWHAPDVQAHRVGLAQTANTFRKQEQKSAWHVSPQTVYAICQRTFVHDSGTFVKGK